MPGDQDAILPGFNNSSESSVGVATIGRPAVMQSVNASVDVGPAGAYTTASAAGSNSANSRRRPSFHWATVRRRGWRNFSASRTHDSVSLPRPQIRKRYVGSRTCRIEAAQTHRDGRRGGSIRRGRAEYNRRRKSLTPGKARRRVSIDFSQGRRRGESASFHRLGCRLPDRRLAAIGKGRQHTHW